MAFSKAVRQKILERDGARCVICGAAESDAVALLEAHHVDPRGMGGDPSKDIPENGMTLCRVHHSKLTQVGKPWRVTYWDCDDPDEGLVVVDGAGRGLPRERLWFYRRQGIPALKEAISHVGTLITQARRAQWAAAGLLMRVKENADLLPEAGYEDVYALGLEMGLSSAEVKRMIRVAIWQKEVGLDLTALDLIVADNLRRVPDEELSAALTAATSLALPDFWAWLHDRYGTKRQRTIRVFSGAFTEHVVRSEDDLPPVPPGAVVIRGGSVISGMRKEAES